MIDFDHVDFEYATEPIREGVWLADARVPALRLEVMDIYLNAISVDDVGYQVRKLLQRMIWRMHHLPPACLN